MEKFKKLSIQILSAILLLIVNIAYAENSFGYLHKTIVTTDSNKVLQPYAKLYVGMGDANHCDDQIFVKQIKIMLIKGAPAIIRIGDIFSGKPTCGVMIITDGDTNSANAVSDDFKFLIDKTGHYVGSEPQERTIKYNPTRLF